MVPQSLVKKPHTMGVDENGQGNVGRCEECNVVAIATGKRYPMPHLVHGLDAEVFAWFSEALRWTGLSMGSVINLTLIHVRENVSYKMHEQSQCARSGISLHH